MKAEYFLCSAQYSPIHGLTPFLTPFPRKDFAFGENRSAAG
jgi:hypothetical protein